MKRAALQRFLMTGAIALAVALAPLGCGSGDDVADLLAASEEKEKEGRAEEALLELRRALQADPKNAEVNFRIARILHRQEQISESVYFYEEAIRLDPRHEEARLVLAFLMLGDDADYSQRLVDDVIARNPKNSLAWVRRSDIALARGDADAALAAALTAVEVAPDHARAQIQLGLVHRARIRKLEMTKQEVPDALRAEALAAFERAGQGRDDSFDKQTVVTAWVERARVLAGWEARRGEAARAYQEAFAFAQKVGGSQDLALQAAIDHASLVRDPALRRWALEQRIALHPEHLSSWRQLAGLIDPADAPSSPTLERLIASRPEDARAHVTYAVDLVKRGRAKDAVAHLGTVASKVRRPEIVLVARVELALEAQDSATAKAAAEQLARDHAASLQNHLAQAQILRSEQRFAEAADAVQTGMDAYGETIRLLTLLAELRLFQGDTEATLTTTERALAASPAPTALEQLGLLRLQSRAQLQRGAPAAALSSFQRMAELTKGKVASADLVPFAHALYATDRSAQGLRMLEVALGLPEIPLEAILMFSRMEGQRDPKRAEALLAKALQASPGHPSLLEEAARFDLAAGRVAQAKQRLSEAVAASPGSAQLHLMLGGVLFASEDYEGALASAEEAMRLAPDSPSPMAATLLLNAYVKLGRVDAAVAKLEADQAAGKLGVGSQVLLARLLTAKRENLRAIALLEQIAAADPTLVGVKNDLAFLLVEEKRDLDRALSLAQEARAALPGNGTIADTLGAAYLAKGLPEAALPQFDEAVGLLKAQSAEWASAQLHRAQALYALGRVEDCRAAAEASLSVPGFAEADAAESLLKTLDQPAKQG